MVDFFFRCWNFVFSVGGCSVHTAFSALDSICQKLGFSMVLPFLAKEFCK